MVLSLQYLQIPLVKIMKKLNLISQKFIQAFRLVPRNVRILIILTLVSFLYMFAFVPLAPTVGNNFFFSSDDPPTTKRTINQ